IVPWRPAASQARRRASSSARSTPATPISSKPSARPQSRTQRTSSLPARVSGVLREPAAIVIGAAYTSNARAMSTATLHLPDGPATEAAGARLASALHPGMIVTLSGELGTGKTTLVRGALRALGWQGRVKSPTYTLVEHYPFSSLYFYHFDFYRFADPSEWETAGLADASPRDSGYAMA